MRDFSADHERSVRLHPRIRRAVPLAAAAL